MFPLLSKILSRLLIDRRNGHRRAVLAAFKEKQRIARLSPEEQERYRNKKLASLLNHARDQVPFWRDKIPEVVTVENAREVLKALPVVTRAMIQEERRRFEAGESVQCSVFGVRGRGEENVPAEGGSASGGQHSNIGMSNSASYSAFQNPNSKFGRVVLDATGGSSGTPMTFLVDHATHIARESSLYWADSLAGWNYGDRIAMLWGSDRDVGNARKNPKLEFRWWIDNRRWFNAFNMGPKKMQRFHEAMTRFRPHVIVAYAGSLEIYARYLKENGVRCSGFGVQGRGEDGPSSQSPAFGGSASGGQIANQKSQIVGYPLTALISSAEVLSPRARELVEDVFGKPVFNRYGNREFGALAAEDGSGGLLVNPVDCIIEIDSPEPFHMPGAIIVTYLHNRAMPFIRYNTGDLGVWVKGEEGRRIARIQGRQGDTIRTKGGKLIHGEYFTHLMYGAPGVKEFQFVQERIDFFRLRVVSARQSEAVEQAWRSKIIEALGEEAEIVVEYVETIPTLGSGKRKFTISLV